MQLHPRALCLYVALALGCDNGVAGNRDSVLESLVLSPPAASLGVGDSTQFAVAGIWSDGSATPPEVALSATGGSIGGTGMYVAGSTPGTYRVVATHIPSGLADTSQVTITATPPPPATVLLEEDFEDDNAASRGWYDNVAWTTTTAEHRATGTRSLAWSWALGAELPSFGGGSRHTFAPTAQVYVSYWIKYSANWEGSGVGFHPHEFLLLTTASSQFTGPSYTPLTTYIEHVYTPAGGIPRIGTADGENIDVTQIGQDLSAVTENRATAGCNGNTDGIPTDCYPLGGGQYNNGKWLEPAGRAPAFLPNPGPGYKGDWHHIEAYFQMNTVVNGIGQTDGVGRYWFDGQLIIERTNVLFRTGENPNIQWNQFILGPYIGVGSPVAQSAWIDDLSIATSRP